MLLVVIFLFAVAAIPIFYFFQGFEPWLFGLRRFITLAQEGQRAFFLGQISYHGWWNYFVFVFIVKTPIGTLFLISATFLLYRFGKPLGRREGLFLLLPVVVFFLVMTQAKVNIGLRHILTVYPFLFGTRLAFGDCSSFNAALALGPVIGLPLVLTAVLPGCGSRHINWPTSMNSLAVLSRVIAT